jgi:hypothetical protein
VHQTQPVQDRGAALGGRRCACLLPLCAPVILLQILTPPPPCLPHLPTWPCRCCSACQVHDQHHTQQLPAQSVFQLGQHTARLRFSRRCAGPWARCWLACRKGVVAKALSFLLQASRSLHSPGLPAKHEWRILRSSREAKPMTRTEGAPAAAKTADTTGHHTYS